MTFPQISAFWRVALVTATVLAVTLAVVPRPPLAKVPDEFQHMLAFGTLTVLAAIAYPRARLLRIGERLSFLGAMIELVQSIPFVHRDCDIMDWVADTSMIAGVLVVVALVRRGRASAT